MSKERCQRIAEKQYWIIMQTIWGLNRYYLTGWARLPAFGRFGRERSAVTGTTRLADAAPALRKDSAASSTSWWAAMRTPTPCRHSIPAQARPIISDAPLIGPLQECGHERHAGPHRSEGGHNCLIGHLSSNGRKFHERREGGEAGTEREEHPFLAGLRPAAVQDLPQNKQNGG